ncbi:MAG: alkaline phosphatase family protein [Balneolia bacterium]|nr:alkaline phosphatase family protein [Balneolia bacterium]
MTVRLLTIVLFISIAVFGLTACNNSDPQENRVIVVSMDGLNEVILRNTLPEDRAPAFYEVFDQGMCAEYAQPAFPSLTAASHASIWMGAFGNVTGITANGQHRLPRSENNVLDFLSGFSYEGLMAEPFWVTAANQGFTAVGHQVTQAPFAGGFPAEDDAMSDRRSEQQEILSRDHVPVFNGYNRQVMGDGVVTSADVIWTDAADWSGAESLEGMMDPRAFTLETPAGNLYGLFTGDGAYDRIFVNTSASLDGAVEARLHEPETESPRNRELARWFSEPLELVMDEEDELERGWLRFRLFEASSEGSDFMLYHPAMHVSESNSSEAQRAYHDAVQGWFGNSSMRMWSNGGFGPTFEEGGDGTAELRFLETAELLTKVFNRGSEWLWRNYDPALMADYFPLPDTIDHNVLGFLSTDYPGYDEEIAAKAADLRTAGWELADIRLQLLMDLADEAGAAIFVTGDHGMRSSWMQFHPNVALREAGLLTVDDDGNIDLSRTQAVSPNGYWITINTTDWQDGIVAPEDREAVMDAVEEALLAARGVNGEQVINRVYRADEHADDLGLSGPAGGDIYWNITEGYRTSRSHRNRNAVNETRLWTTHGYDSTDPDMYTAFCGYGGGFSAGRFGGVRTIDIAPTAGAYVGFGSPADATGRNVLDEMR